jgi:hypothetical protein
MWETKLFSLGLTRAARDEFSIYVKEWRRAKGVVYLGGGEPKEWTRRERAALRNFQGIRIL